MSKDLKIDKMMMQARIQANAQMRASIEPMHKFLKENHGLDSLTVDKVKETNVARIETAKEKKDKKT